MVGRTVRLDDRPHTIVGVMPAGFAFHDEAEIWVRAARGVPQLAIDAGADVATTRGLSYMRAFGRLRPGVALRQARAELAAVARRQERDFPKTNSRRGVLLVAMRDEIAGDVRAALWVLLGAVAFVQVIACANIASLLLARATVRRREVALRMTQGATRGRLARQLLTESLLLAALAGAGGWRRSASTASWPTPWRSAPVRSACGWRSARGAAPSSARRSAAAWPRRCSASPAGSAAPSP